MRAEGLSRVNYSRQVKNCSDIQINKTKIKFLTFLQLLLRQPEFTVI